MTEDSNEIQECYGDHYGKLPECKTCKYAEYCREAGDPAIISQIQYDDSRSAPLTEKIPLSEPEHTYTADQMAELFRRLIYLDDPRLRKIIQMKLENPSVSFSEIGRHYGITKQAIHQYVKTAVEYFPELKVILQNRPIYNRWRGRVVIKYKKRNPLMQNQPDLL